MSIRNITALILILSSLACLYPGLTQKMMIITASAELPLVGKLKIYESSQSIVETIEHLFRSKDYFVAWLLLLFSVLVPITKAVMLLIVLLFKNFKIRPLLFKIVSAIGKWSMADVFVVSIFMAYLSTGSNTAISAGLLNGFYYFTAYCFLSILGTQLIDLHDINNKTY